MISMEIKLENKELSLINKTIDELLRLKCHLNKIRLDGVLIITITVGKIPFFKDEYQFFIYDNNNWLSMDFNGDRVAAIYSHNDIISLRNKLMEPFDLKNKNDKEKLVSKMNKRLFNK